MHADTADAVEYRPTVHTEHVVAPVLEPVFVIEPAAQALHDESVDAAEYRPAAHGVQLVALAFMPVSVIEPATHSEQYV